MDGFVVTSMNMGVIRTEENEAKLVFAPRSSVATLQEEMKEPLRLFGEVFGFETSFSGEYPGWSYKEESPVRQVLQESYRELFGEELKVVAIHAGLECGLFSGALPALDAIPVGPTLKDVHTPDESLPLDSFERFYRFLKDALSRVAEQ